jgi:hypothetical protein
MTTDANTTAARRRGLTTDQVLMLWVAALALLGLAALVATTG